MIEPQQYLEGIFVKLFVTGSNIVPRTSSATAAKSVM